MNIEQRLEEGSVRITETGCRVWLGAWDAAGYGKIHAGRHMRVHQAAFLASDGHIPPLVRHKCDTRSCSERSHLEAGCHADNSNDMVERGRQARGEGHGMSKLTENIVRDIRQARCSGKAAAAKYGISESLVSQVRLRQVWGHIE